MPLTFGSLFAGIGGFDLGFERAGMQCKWQVEINDYATKVLEKHWPNVRRWRDVRTFPPRTFEFSYSQRGMPIGPFTPDTRRDSTADQWRVDIICGGDPCQSNSATVGAGSSIAESLGGEFIRVVDALRPRIVVRENPRHIRADAPWPWWRFRSELESIGYAVLPFRLRACCLGKFHQRDRMFVLGELPADANGKRLEGREKEKESRLAGKPAGRIYPNDWLTVSASRGFRSRAGLPGYVDRIRGLGNAVVPQVAQWIGERLIHAEEKQRSNHDGHLPV